MKFLLSLSTLLLLTFKVNSQNEKIIEKCLDVFKVQYCSSTTDDNNVLWNLWTVMNTFITIQVPDACVGLGFHYSWVLKQYDSDITINTFERYKNQSRLYIQANSVQGGEYNLELIISHSKTLKTQFFKCAMRFKNAPIIAAIAGASLRTIHSGDTIKLDGSYTYKGGHSNINYKWVGDRLGQSKEELKAYGEVTSLTFRGNVGQQWNITLIAWAGNQKSSASVSVIIGSTNTPVLDIICSQNCPEAGSYWLLPKMTINLEVICYKACGLIDIYSWNGHPQTPDAYMVFGDKNSRLSLRYDWFNEPVDIKIDVYAKSKGKSLVMAQLTKSAFVRTSGTANCPPVTEIPTDLLSVIHQKCSSSKDVVSYTMIQNIDERFVLVLAQNMAPEFEIRASHYSPAPLRFRVEGARLVILDEIYVEVTTSSNLPSDYSNTMHLAMEMFSEQSSIICPHPSLLGLEGRVWEAVQLLNVIMPKLFEEETDKNSKHFSIKLCTRILDDIRKFPTETALDSLIIILLRLLRPKDEPKDRQYALALSNTCEHLALKRKEHLKTTNPLLYESVVMDEYRVLKTCAELLMTSNYQKLKVGVVTTPPPMEGHPANVEDYPSYEDLITDNMRNEYMEITNKSIEICMVASYIRVMTWAYGEMELLLDEEFFQPDRASLITRDIILHRCRILLPQNIGFDDDEKLRVIVNIFNETLLFWEASDVTVNTVIVNLRFVDADGDESFNLPELAHLFLNTSEVSNTPFEEANASLSEGHESFNDTNIPVYRIDMRNASILRLAFSEISQPLRVVIIEARRPVMSDFNESILVSGNYQRVEVDLVTYDIWYYIGLIPEVLAPKLNRIPRNIRSFGKFNFSVPYKKMTLEGNIRSSNVNATFRISVFSQKCVEWKNNTWYHSDCVIGTKSTDSIVHCQCYSITNVAAFSITPNLKRCDMTTLHFHLENSPTYIPLIFMVCVIALYCLVILSALIRRRSAQQIYYLCDNLSIHNYAYLVRVKTSEKLNAGTSANIVIKIHGEKAKSRPHVLNYPDPDKNLLQCDSDDYFVLTTRKHLGELKTIELWSDCLQIRPSWRCDFVKICDLQKRIWYTFEVHNLFSPVENYKHYVSVKVGKTGKKIGKRMFLKKLWSIFRFKFGAEHTWNFFSRKDDESFGYFERVTIILANISIVCAGAMFLSCNPKFDVPDGIYDDNIMKPLRLILYILLTCLITFPVSVLLVFMFRNLTREWGRRYNYNEKILPEKLKYLSWSLLSLVIILSILYVIFMGVGISEGAAIAWIIILIMALIINVVILESLFIGFMDFLNLFKKSKTIYNYDNIVNESQRQKEYLRKVIPNRYSLRPYMTHLYKPMDKNRYERKRAQITHRIKISNTFQDFTVFIVYFMLLYVLVALNLDSHRTIFSEHMKEMMNGQLDGLELEKVRTIDQLVEYLNETFILTLHAYTWYGNYSANDPGLMIDFQTKFLGIARFRQKRVVATKCPDPNLSREIFNLDKCIPPYSLKTEDKTSMTKKSMLWRYSKPSEAGLTAYFGYYANYYGGGYIGYAGRTLQNAYYNMKEISNENWFDKYTRAVFIEFWAYNANTNLFSIITICFEIYPGGYVTKTSMIYSLSLIFADHKSHLIILSMFLFYCMLVFYQLVNLISKIIYQKLAFWKETIHYLDLIILIGNLAVVGLQVHKEMVVDKILDELSKNKNNEFTKYFSAEYYIDVITIFIAILMCISVIGTWRFLRFGFMFKVFEMAIKTQTNPLISAFVYSITMYIPYLLISRILFGCYTEMFKNMYSSIVVISLLGVDQYPDYNFDEIQSMLPVGSMIFFATYRIWQLIVVNLYIAIITLHYEDSRSFVSNQKEEFSIMSYFIEELKYFKAYFKRKRKYLKGGSETKANVYETKLEDNQENLKPKVTKKFHDEGQSSGVIYTTSNKLQLMSLVYFASLYNEHFRQDKNQITDEEYDLMEAITWYYQNSNEGERLTFYQMEIDENKSHVMQKEDVEEMEKVTNKMCEPETEEEPEEEEVKKPKAIPDGISLKRLSIISESLMYVDRIMKNINVVKKPAVSC